MKTHEKARSLLFVAALAAGCAPRVAAPATVDVAPPGQIPPAPEKVLLPPLTAEEQDIAGRLRATVTHLAVEIGDRSVDQSWNVASATDDLAVALEKIGYDVRRQGIVAGDAVVQNIEAHVTGGEHGAEAFVVGAHFDTVKGTPGADDASGVAAVMELARSFQGAKPKRALHFALFVNGEAPFFQTDQMGSLVYAKDLKAKGLAVRGMVSLDGLGAFGEGPPARAYPTEISPPYPPTSDFLAIVGNEESRAFLEQVTTAMRHGSVPVVSSVLASDLPYAASSDHWAFWKLGIPAVLLTDAAPYRYKDHEQKTDLPDKLDFERMARVVAALKKTLEGLIDA